MLRQLLRQQPVLEQVAAELRKRSFQYVVVAARGSSDHAGLYAKYLLGAVNGLVVALAAPSLATIYGQSPNLRDALVIGISQSGQSPDILQVVTTARQQGAPTLAITNAPASPLAHAAEFSVNIDAGPERAVAATKTYTAELVAIALLSCALQDDATRWPILTSLPDAVAQVLAQEAAIAHAAARYTALERCFVLGRGFNYATAFELALKLKELTYVTAEAYSTADFQHGPVAVIEPGFPVIGVAPSGAVLPTNRALFQRLVALGAELVVLSDAPELLELATTPLTLPTHVPEWLSPVVAIVAGQLFAVHLALAKGRDPDQPRSLSKITRTR